ncbi:Uncharacterized protein GBIM_05344, partial [Gryllus bimaculatus]
VAARGRARPSRIQRRDVDDPQTLKERSSKHCDKFTDGDPDKNRFYSPLYGTNYPNSTDCYRILDGNNSSALDIADKFPTRETIRDLSENIQIVNGI